MTARQFVAVDANAKPWEEFTTKRVKQTLYRKFLFSDPETGALFAIMRYPAGVMNPSHTHPCGHGMYILEGRLVTHRGEFGPVYRAHDLPAGREVELEFVAAGAGAAGEDGRRALRERDSGPYAA